MKKLLLLGTLLMASAAILTGCGAGGNSGVAAWDTVRVNYVGTLASDGTVFDTSLQAKAEEAEIYNDQRTYEPLEFSVWAGQMIPGFDAGVVGMKVGESKTITIPAVDGYGEYTEEKIQDLPLDTFSGSGVTPEVGMELNFWFTRGVVLEVTDETAKIDLNHFLAGKDLIFEVEMVEIITPSDVAGQAIAQ